MVRASRWCAAVATLAVLLPAFAADEKTETKESRAAREKLLGSSKPFLAKLLQVEGSQKYLTVDITVQTPLPNLDAQRNLLNLQQQLLDAQRESTPLSRARRIRDLSIEMEKNKRNLVTMREEHQRLELQAADDMKVRTMILPLEYDDKGKPKKLTQKELKELKGPDAKLPGYAATFDDLKAEQIVEVYLARPKTTAPPVRSRVKDSKDKDVDPAAPESDKPVVIMIVIHKEPAK